MKKMVSILIILSITVISLGNFFIKDSVFMNFFYKKHHKIPIICINTGDTAPYQG